MTSAYYSTIFRKPAADVWKIVRDFNNYPVWVGGAGESEIEDGKTGDTVGAVRSVHFNGRHIRQRLLALSDVERSQTYEFCGAASLPVSGFQATLRVTPVVDGDGAFIEWWADFDCEGAGARSSATVARLVREMARIAADGYRQRVGCGRRLCRGARRCTVRGRSGGFGLDIGRF